MHNQVFQKISMLETGGRNRLRRGGWGSEYGREGKDGT